MGGGDEGGGGAPFSAKAESSRTLAMSAWPSGVWSHLRIVSNCASFSVAKRESGGRPSLYCPHSHCQRTPHAKARAGGGTHLAGEQALREPGEDGRAVVEAAVQRLVLLLGALAVEHVVLALLRDGRDEPQLVRDVDRLLDLAHGPLGRAPVERLVCEG